MIEIFEFNNKIGYLLLISVLFPLLMPFSVKHNDIIIDVKNEITEIGTEIARKICIKTFTLYTEILHNGKETYTYYYENNVLFQRIMIDGIEIYDKIHSIIFDYNLELKLQKDYWININVLNNIVNIDESKTEYILNENYYLLEQDDEKNTSLMYEHNINKIKNMKKNDLITLLIIIKNHEKYHTIVNLENEINYTSEKSKVKFLSIEYEDPVLKLKTEIKLDENIFYENNEILSSAFIKRYIDYNPISINYTPEYKLNIMDNNINSITITKDHYIKLGKKKYEIVHMK
mgnify:CR=1 FL=1|tara:strand:- start:3676 stop:4542 length:867 start_codon:yes stop_codon:yes gene_type:complete